jgi:aspartyl-tRNA(Asn)/glutamyl-tRNA(Gln) amidotransferase subunit B
MVANWISSELFAVLNRLNKTIEESPIGADDLGALIDLIADDTISGKIAKDVFADMIETGQKPGKIVESKGLRQVSDTGAIEQSIRAILAENADKVAEFKSGKDKLFGFFVGQVMKATQGKANPGLLNDLLKKILAE